MTTAADNRPGAGHGSAWRFVRHYLEMVAAMLAGMAALGVSQLVVEVPGGTGVELVEMAVWMTVPMVAWMRYRGHAWRPCAEMTLAMLLPTAGALTLLCGGVVTDADTLVMLDHSVMFPAMFVAMLLRRDEYTAHDHGAEPHPVAG